MKVSQISVRPGRRSPAPYLLKILLVSLCALGTAGLDGCSTPSPRFRSPAEPTEDDESRYASRIREEEKRWDDRPVDVSTLARSYRAGRDSSRPNEEILPAGLNRDRVLLDIVGLLGTPYRYGGNDRGGIDCSGFTTQVYASAAGRALPRSTREQFRLGETIGRAELRFGDLVFFNTTGASPSHVGIYIEDDLFAHASVTYGVTISSLESTYYRERFVGARRIAE